MPNLTVPNALRVECSGAIAIVTIDRPEKLNALNVEVLSALERAVDEIEKDDAIRVLVITGAGEKAFVAGSDIETLARMNSIEVYQQMLFGHRIFLRICEFAKPTIAMVNGYALGGGFELALSCDLLMASEKATFGFPEINLNTMPGWGGTQLAVQKMGPSRAKEMVMTGHYYPASTCYDFGFINRLVPPDQLRSVTMGMAEALAEKHPFAIKMAKNALGHAQGGDLRSGIQYEAMAYTVNFSGPHAQEGFNAFLNRKRPAQ